MKKLLSACMAIVLSFGLLSGCGNTASSATSGAASGGGSDLGTPQTFKFGLTVASTHPYAIASQNFAELVEEKSGGNMKVELYYDSSLGDDVALLESLQMNGVTFALMGPAGVQMRSMTSDMAIKSWECLNVQPVPISFGELFLAMQQGVVDGQETTIGSFYTSKFYEVQKYLTNSNRVFHVMTFLMSNAAWEGLTEAQQNILLEAVAESKAAHKDYMTTYNEEALKDMQDNYGVTVSELEDGEFEKMREMSQPVYDMVEEYDPELYAQLMEEAEAANAAYPAA